MKYTIKQVGRYGYFATDIPKNLQTTLYNKLSYVKKGTEFMPNPMWGYVYFYKKRTNSFPIGLLSTVETVMRSFCKIYDCEYVVDFTNIVKSNVSQLSEELRPYQIDAIQQLNNNNGGIIHLPTGSGKTFTCVEYLNQFENINILVVVPTLDLRTQWQKEKITNNFDVKTYQSIKNYEILTKYDIVVFDECHHLPAKSLYNIAMKCHNSIMVGLSATPFRDDGEDMRMFAALGNIVYSISLRELIKQGYLADAHVHILEFKHNTPDIFSEYQDIINIHIVNNEERNKAICEMAHSAEKPCLILVDQIQHGENIQQLLNVPFIHGKSKNRTELLENLKKGQYDIAIASKVYNEGIDVPILNSLVLAAGGRSSVKITQQIGRVLRIYEDHTIVHIYDVFDGLKYVKQHSSERLEIYNEHFDVIQWMQVKN